MSRRKGTSGDYEVGYGKPPVETQFKTGQSGNPKGRPKNSKNFSTMMEEELNELMVIVSNGRRRSVPFMRVAVKQLKAQAIGGSLKAIITILQLAEKYGFDREQVASWFSKDQDLAIIDDFLSRQQKQEEDEGSGGQSGAS